MQGYERITPYILASDDRIYKSLYYDDDEPDRMTEMEVNHSHLMHHLGIGPAIYNVVYYKDHLVIEMDRYPYDLSKYLQQVELSNEQQDHVACQVHSLLWNLAKAGFLNGDIKDCNIVYDDNTEQMKMIDFEPDLFLYIGPNVQEQEAILLLAIMELLYYYYTEHYGNNLFHDLPSGRIGYFLEPWQNKVMLILGGRAILATRILTFLMTHYNRDSKTNLEELINALERGLTNTQKSWMSQMEFMVRRTTKVLASASDANRILSEAVEVSEE